MSLVTQANSRANHPPAETSQEVPVLFSGLTASSKTAYSRLFATATERPWFDATTYLKGLSGIRASNDNIWASEHAAKIHEVRQGDYVDRIVDQLLRGKLEENPSAVVDAWAMPWLWQDPAVRVFVHADLETRVQRCIESSRSGRVLFTDEARELVSSKDEYARELFLRLYGFDLMRDHGIFDVLLDTSGFIPDTAEQSGQQIVRERIGPLAQKAISLACRQASSGEPKQEPIIISQAGLGA